MVRRSDLLLRGEGGALAVCGVVGEVVGEGLGVLPHRFSWKAVSDLMEDKDTAGQRGGQGPPGEQEQRRHLQVDDGRFASLHPDDASGAQVLLPAAQQNRVQRVLVPFKDDLKKSDQFQLPN